MASALIKSVFAQASRWFWRPTSSSALRLGWEMPAAATAAAASSSSSNPLMDALWLAAPKSKVTPSRKKIRNNHPSKRLKNIVHFQTCELCGEKKLRHRLCMSCFKKGKYFTK